MGGDAGGMETGASGGDEVNEGKANADERNANRVSAARNDGDIGEEDIDFEHGRDLMCIQARRR